MQLLRRPSLTSKRYEQQFIALLGPGNAGKTTYMATLLHWEGAPQNQYFDVTDTYGDAETLKRLAKDVLCQGQSFQRTPVGSVFDIRKYGLNLEISPQPLQKVGLDLMCEDYPGEVFAAMQSADPDQELNRDKPGNPSFMDEIFRPEIVGCLIFLDAWLDDPPPPALTHKIAGWDAFYLRCLQGFYTQANNRQRVSNLRLVVAFGKCERGEAWPARLDPEFDIFRRRFPQTHKFLSNKWPRNNLWFHALSTFGVLDPIQDSRPNRKTTPDPLTPDTLRYSDFKDWNPYGVISPLYWLCTGHKMNPHV